MFYFILYFQSPNCSTFYLSTLIESTCWHFCSFIQLFTWKSAQNVPKSFQRSFNDLTRKSKFFGKQFCYLIFITKAKQNFFLNRKKKFLWQLKIMTRLPWLNTVSSVETKTSFNNDNWLIQFPVIFIFSFIYSFCWLEVIKLIIWTVIWRWKKKFEQLLHSQDSFKYV